MSYRENLYTFLTVYRLGSQQKAALELHLTQPAVSQHIKILEHYVGKQLFFKEGRALLPTPVAHQLALQIRDSFSKLDNALHTLKGNHASMSGVVIIGGICEFFTKIMLQRLKPLTQFDIQLRFETDYVTLVPRLLNGEIDIAHFTAHVVHPNVVVEKLFHQEFVLIGHPDFKKQLDAKKTHAGKAEALSQMPWIAYSESLLFINEYFQTVFNQSFDAPVKLLVKDLWAILEAVRCGIGISIMPSYFCEEALRQKKICILYQPPNPPTHDFYLGWKHGALLDPKIKLIKELLLKA